MPHLVFFSTWPGWWCQPFMNCQWKKSPCRNDSHQQSQHIVLDRLKSPTQSMWGWYGSIWGLQEFRTAIRVIPHCWSYKSSVAASVSRPSIEMLPCRDGIDPVLNPAEESLASLRWTMEGDMDGWHISTGYIFHSISCILLIFLKFSNLLVLGPRTSTHLQAIRTKSVLISTLEAILEDDSYLFHLFISS